MRGVKTKKGAYINAYANGFERLIIAKTNGFGVKVFFCNLRDFSDIFCCKNNDTLLLIQSTHRCQRHDNTAIRLIVSPRPLTGFFYLIPKIINRVLPVCNTGKPPATQSTAPDLH